MPRGWQGAPELLLTKARLTALAGWSRALFRSFSPIRAHHRRMKFSTRARALFLVSVISIALLSACGSGSNSSSAPSAEAQSAAAGDIPDNQQFLTFHDNPAGYSMKYPEGWA